MARTSGGEAVGVVGHRRLPFFARPFGRGLFHAGDLQARFEQTVGSCFGSFGIHSYPQRSQRITTKVFSYTATMGPYHGP
jgi:hypothetical protein